MDGFTQGVIGAAAAQAFLSPRLGRWALLIGWGAGMLPDADLFLRSASDPMWSTVTHRGFTHSLLFIPIGAALATLPFMLSANLRARWRLVYLAALIGYATHAPLDTLTTYGTQIFWPFANTRVAFDIIGIVDPIFTLALLGGVIASGVKRRNRPARVAFAIAGGYLLFCGVQHQRGLDAQARLAEARDHLIAHGRVLPTPGNAFLYRSIYRDADGVIHSDAVRVPLFSGPTYRYGDSVQTFDPVADGIVPKRAKHGDRLIRDLRRYEWFTDGFWARSPDDPSLIGDMRITVDVAEMRSMWGIKIDLNADLPVQRYSRPRDQFDIGGFWREIIGNDPRHKPVP